MQWSSAQILSSLTIDAAHILNLDQEIGSIEPGKLADLAVFTIDPLEHGADNPYDLLVHGKTTLSDLFVDGSAIVTAGKLVND